MVPLIFAIDFDGVLCENAFPEIGEEKKEVVEAVRELGRQGHSLILWTCRRDDRLAEAVEWCEARGLEWEAINANIPSNIQQYRGDTRKVYADYYIDDKALNESQLVHRMESRGGFSR